jgi:dTDP-glucose 4,6-dehydratase
MKDKILVIGSNSFSGASYVKFLLERNHSVLGVSRSEEKGELFLPYKWIKHQDFTFNKFDLNYDVDSLVSLVQKEKISYIINFAAQSMVGESWENPEDWFLTNSVALSRLIKKLNKISFIKKYVHVTTPEVYGSCSGFISENAPINPSTPYATSRVASDLILKNYFDGYGFPFVATRAANVFGPGQQLYRIIPKAIYSILSGIKIPLHGGGESTRSFISMDDVSEATYSIMYDGLAGETYHISTNELISIKELVDNICKKLNKNFSACVTLEDDRIGKDKTYQLSSEKLRNQFSWAEKKSLDESLNETIDWVIKYFKQFKTEDLIYKHKL